MRWLIATATALLCTGGYLVACAIWPWTACRRCHGTGKHPSPTGRAWRLCRHCNGSGARLRIGRRAWTYWQRTRRA